MKKYDKKKQDKINDNNRQDFDLAYDYILSGASWSDYKQAMQDDSVQQEQPDITEDDILSAWILGKDEQQNTYQEGGKAMDVMSTVGEIGSFIGMFDKLGGTINQGITSTFGGAANDPYQKAVYGDFSNGFASGILNHDAQVNDQLNQINFAENRFDTGDSAYLMSQYGQYNPLQKSSSNAKLGNITANIVGVGIPALFGYDAVEAKNRINDAVDIRNRQNIANFNTATTNSNRLNTYNQLYNIAANGGKMKHIHDNGGYLNSHYDYITDPLTRINAGGTHQENPNEGVQVSIAPDGQPNLVEEGETIIDNGNDAYVFSDRIVADEEILKSHLLNDKFAGKTYADISKELDKIINEHKTDEISINTFEEMIKRLQEAQEDQKFQEKQEEVSRFLNSLTDEQKDNLEQEMINEVQQEVEEQQQMQEQAAQQEAQQEIPQEQVPEQQIVPEQGLINPSPTQTPYDQVMSRAQISDAANQGMFGRGGHINQLGSEIDNTRFVRNELNPIQRKAALDKRQKDIEDAFSKGYPYVEPIYQSEFDKFWNGEKARLIYPDGKQEIRSNFRGLTEDGQPIFLNAGVAPTVGTGPGNIFSAANAARNAAAIEEAMNTAYSVEKAAEVAKAVNTVEKTSKVPKWLGKLGKGLGISFGLSIPYSIYQYENSEDNQLKKDQEDKQAQEYFDNILDTISDDNYLLKNKFGKGGHLHQDGNLLDEITVIGEYNPPKQKPAILLNAVPINYDLRDSNFVDYSHMFDNIDSHEDIGVDDKKGNLSTWSRYMPFVGSAFQSLSDSLGLTNKNDFSNVDIFQRKVDSIPDVGFTPIGGYMTYTPFDETYQQNTLRSINEASRRAAVNNANGNAGAVLANLAAINSQENNAIGNLAIQAKQYNNAERLKIAEHNANIDRINSMMSLTTKEKNQAIAAEKAKMYREIATMRQNIIDANDMAKSQNYNNLFTNLGNIGRENFIMNQVNSNMGLYYGVDGNGNAYYKSAYNNLSDDAKKLVDEEIKKNGLIVR